MTKVVDLNSRFRGADRISAPDLWDDITNREPRSNPHESRRLRRVMLGALGLLVAAGGVGFAVWAFSGYGQSSPASRPSVAPSEGNGLIYFQGGGEGGTWTDAINSDGSGRHRVLAPSSYHADLAWSPDGSQMAYVGIVRYAEQSPDGEVRYGIFVANADGSGARLLTEGLNEGWPSWSPDGTRIAFSSTRARPGAKGCEAGGDMLCPTDIFVVNADGTGITRVTEDAAPEWAPAWSPDGGSLAFVRSDVGTEAIDVVSVDGGDFREIATGTGGNQRPFTWSPDGRQIAFVGIASDSWDIDVVNADGTSRRTVFSRDGVWNEGPVWSPDGSEIAFSSTLGAYPPGCGASSDACSDLFVIHPDGSGITRLTHDATGVYGIAWRPRS